jgi:mRNA-degrading endonuclease YafQ of YafQ-DinJ toxin-antitoxin module
MHELVLTPHFERSFKRLVGKHPAMRVRIEATLRRMAEDINDPKLRTHHLIGQLDGLFACTVSYDCRIVFSRQPHPKTKKEVLLLINIGSHDEVY